MHGKVIVPIICCLTLAILLFLALISNPHISVFVWGQSRLKEYSESCVAQVTHYLEEGAPYCAVYELRRHKAEMEGYSEKELYEDTLGSIRRSIKEANIETHFPWDVDREEMYFGLFCRIADRKRLRGDSRAEEVQRAAEEYQFILQQTGSLGFDSFGSGTAMFYRELVMKGVVEGLITEEEASSMLGEHNDAEAGGRQ